MLAKKRDNPGVDVLHPALAFDHPGWEGSVEKQAELSKRVAADLGFDFSKGRFDVSTHPFWTCVDLHAIDATSVY